MKNFKRILFAALFVALGCVALPKNVKADEIPDVTLTVNQTATGSVSYTCENPGTDNKMLLYITKDGGSKVLLTTISPLAASGEKTNLIDFSEFDGITANTGFTVSGVVLTSSDVPIPSATPNSPTGTVYYGKVADGTNTKLVDALANKKTMLASDTYTARITTDTKKSYVEDKSNSLNVGKIVTVTVPVSDGSKTTDDYATVKTLVGSVSPALPTTAVSASLTETLSMAPVTDFSGYSGIYVYAKVTQTSSDTGSVSASVSYTGPDFTVSIDPAYEGTGTCTLKAYVFDSQPSDGYTPTDADYTNYGIWTGSFTIDTRTSTSYIDITDEDGVPIDAPVSLTSGQSMTFLADSSGVTHVYWVIKKLDSNLSSATMTSSGVFKATLLSGKTSSHVQLYAGDATSTAAMTVSDYVDITITKAATGVTLSLPGITAGYSVDLNDYTSVPSGDDPSDVTWTVATGDTFADVDASNTLSVDADADKDTITLVPELNGVTYVAQSVTVYEPVIKTKDPGTASSGITVKLPKAVYTYDDSYNISSVKGYKVRLLDAVDGTPLGGASSVKSASPGTVSISASTIESIIEEISYKYANDKNYKSLWDSDDQDVRLEIIPVGTYADNKSKTVANNSATYISESRETSCIEIDGDDHLGDARIFGQDGYSIDMSKLNYDEGYTYEKVVADGKTLSTVSGNVKFGSVDEVKVTTTKKGSTSSSSSTSGSTTSKNSTTSGGGTSGLDKVPKTGEGVMGFWLIAIAVIAGAIAASILFGSYFPMKKAKKAKTEEVKDETDIKK